MDRMVTTKALSILVAVLATSLLLLNMSEAAASGTSAAQTCNCGLGYSCCHDKMNGAMCYKPSEYACVGGRLCQAGSQLCGSSCYDPRAYQCVDGSMLCQASESVCQIEGKPQCYSKQNYHCYNGNLLCAVREGECSGRCYHPDAYQCFNGTMCAITEGICMINGQPQCFDKAAYTCYNNEVMCSVAEQECNGQCYDPAVHQCMNGTLCPADSTGCSPSPGEPAVITCQGRRANAPDVCSGQGTCVSQDSCTCNQGFFGADCSVSAQPDAVCYGTPSSDASVCTGRGVCTANDTCVCSTGFSGVECENIVCPIGQSGASCEKFSCFGVESSDASACSGNGVCVRPNTCSCKPGYYGRLCDKTGSGNTKPCLFAIGQNEFPELQAYAEAFTPSAGGSMYSNIFEKGLGPTMENYLAKMNENYPGSKVLFGLDAKAMFYWLYGGYDKTKNTAQMFKDILEGKFNVDNNLLSFATSLKKYTSLTILMRIDYEVSGNLHANTNENAWDTTTQDPTFYRKAFCKVANRFRELQVNNVEFVYHPNRGDHQSLYPDPSCVDWIGFSVFNHDVVQPTYDGNSYYWNNQSGTIDMNLKRGFDWAKSTGKKLMISESSVQRPNSRTVEGMRTYFERVLSIIDTFQLDAWFYINSDWISKSWSGEWDDSRIESKPDEFKQWWKQTIVDSPRFIHYN